MQLTSSKDYRKTGFSPRFLWSAFSQLTSRRNDFLRLLTPPVKNRSLRKKESTSSLFPDFAYPAEQLSAFVESQDFFVICHENLNISSFVPADREAFRHWLQTKGVRDINGPEWVKCKNPIA
jgi:hypothetical protein